MSARKWTPLIVLLAAFSLLSQSASAQSVEAVVAKVQPSVAVILSKNAKGLESGTGFAVSNHLVVTAYHVVRGATAIVLKFPNFPVVRTDVIGQDPEADVALLQIPPLPVRPLPLGDFSSAQAGESIVVIGFPRVDVLGAQTATVTEGIISAIRPGALQIQVPVSPGNSGGPVVNLRGEVLGIVESTLTGAQQINFARAVTFAQRLLRGTAANPPPALTPSVPAPNPSPAPGRSSVTVSACHVPSFAYPQGYVVFNEHGIAAQFRVDVADTPESQKYGLMCRASLEANAGMLFAFPTNVGTALWMKNIYMPLTAVFFDDSWRIVSIMNMNVAPDPQNGPFTRYAPPQPYRYALVINQGAIEQYQIDEQALVGFIPLQR